MSVHDSLVGGNFNLIQLMSDAHVLARQFMWRVATIVRHHHYHYHYHRSRVL